MPGSAVLATRLALAHACCLSCAKQDGLRYLAFLFRRVEIAVCAFLRRCGARGLDGVTWALSTRRGLRSVCGIALLSQRFDFGLRQALPF